MKTIDQIKDRCRVDEFTGRRAAWLALGRELPSGWRVYGTCESLTCVNPAHIKAGLTEEFGAHTRKTGSQRGNINRIKANRLSGRKRAALQPEQVAEVITSNETGLALAASHGVSMQTISKYRRHGLPCYEPVGGLFHFPRG